MILDIYSRYVVGFTVAARESAEIAEDLRSALEQIESVLTDLEQRANIPEGKNTADAAK